MDWTRGQAIGHGSSATVSLATSHLYGSVFAVKSAELSQSEFLQREQQILSSLSVTPHMVNYKGYDVTMENNMLMYNLFMEYVPGGTLTDVIRTCGGRLEESVIGCYTQQIVQGLEYLHSQGFVHCDIKGRNILISEENGAKIADFGCARWVDDKVGKDREMPKIGGTPMFMAPEVVHGEEQGFPCDIWALGCTVIEMATGGAPWPNVSDPISALFQIAYSGELPEFPSFLSEQANDFLDKCLRRSPKERWTASQLLKHPFLVEFNSSAKIIQESSYSNSPTTILDQGFWNSLEDSELNLGSLIEENPGAERIRRLSLLSEAPDWTWDEKWITIRGNNGEEINMIMDVAEAEADGIMCCSGSATASISKAMVELKSTVGSEGLICFSDSNLNSSSGNLISFFQCGKRSVALSHFGFERDKDKLFLPSIPSF
ncbi:mitogen-activated protein kinase kinase kinase 18-like [Juglans microcarpa x Juglans regia]|uniref:mitogen-activated protein kinase kinase kinase 18-like n=1 Tax=Juglans microcarpa x Juglans regia TaxID=2249226 RepID=UPI001B7F1182|nr:mitogen-activated protein kinase kinase kinase 18-like [Juglans microcarpa x Juglans regia]